MPKNFKTKQQASIKPQKSGEIDRTVPSAEESAFWLEVAKMPFPLAIQKVVNRIEEEEPSAGKKPKHNLQKSRKQSSHNPKTISDNSDQKKSGLEAFESTFSNILKMHLEGVLHHKFLSKDYLTHLLYLSA